MQFLKSNLLFLSLCLLIFDNVNGGPPIFGAMSSVVHGMTDAFKNPVNKIMDIPSDIVDLITNTANKESTNQSPAITDVIQGLPAAVLQHAQELPASVLQHAQELPASVLQHVQELPNSMIGLASEVPAKILGATGPIMNTGKAIPDALSGVTNQIVPADIGQTVNGVKDLIPLENIQESLKPDDVLSTVSNAAGSLNPSEIVGDLTKVPGEIAGSLTKNPAETLDDSNKNPDQPGPANNNVATKDTQNPDVKENVENTQPKEVADKNVEAANQEKPAAAAEQPGAAEQKSTGNAIERKARNADYNQMDSWENYIFNYDLYQHPQEFETDSANGNHLPSTHDHDHEIILEPLYYPPINDHHGSIYRQSVTIYSDDEVTAAVHEDAVITGPKQRLLY